MAIQRTLTNVAILESLENSERVQLESQCSWRRYRTGERVFDRGSDRREVYFVISGAVNVINFARSGNEVAFAIAHQGNFFGEMAAIDGQPRSASVVAGEDSIIAVLPGEVFVELLKQQGEIAFQLLKRLSFKVREASGKVMNLSTMKASTRIYAELLRLASPDELVSDLWVIDPLPPLRTIAREVSTNQGEVGATLQALYETGLLKRKGERLYIMDPKALQDIIDTT